MGNIRIITKKVLTAAFISKIFSCYYADICKFIWWLQKIFQVIFLTSYSKCGKSCKAQSSSSNEVINKAD